jgi:4-amino-4-deoxy-L-arabinose transferase-like glycosyltransferase
VIAVWITICNSSYAPNDGDGTLYSNIAAKVAKMEMSELIQVGWYDYNRTYSPDAAESRYFYEHPPGLFILPWFLAKLGLPVTKLTLLAETFYQVVALFFFYLLLKKWANRTIAGWFTLSILFMPVSFWYVLRPVHETPMLAALVAALYLVSYFSELRLLVLALLFLTGGIAGLMKGIMVAPISVVCGLAGFILPRPKKNSLVVAALCFSAFGAGAYCFLTAFDKYRMLTTGDTFWLHYLRIQLWNRALEDSSTLHVLFRTIKHGLLYAGAMLYYTLPWGLAGCIYGFQSIRKVESFKVKSDVMVICIGRKAEIPDIQGQWYLVENETHHPVHCHTIINVTSC